MNDGDIASLTVVQEVEQQRSELQVKFCVCLATRSFWSFIQSLQTALQREQALVRYTKTVAGG
jgi:hypothetical protein